jgi:GTPase SAR1 family protein
MANIPTQILEKIRQVKEQHLSELDLRSDWSTSQEKKLTEIPAKVFELQWLEKLDISSHQLSQLPPEIAQLSNLQVLNLSHNQLSKLPSAIVQLTNLQVLILSYNQLNQLSPKLAQLTRLHRLDLRGNQLRQLPPEIAQLPNLQTIFLDQNQLERLPSEFAQFSCLQQLYLSHNKLSKLPLEITELSNLQVLDLDSNQLKQLPPEIAQLPNLQVLSIRSNQLRQLPPAIAQLPNLQTINISVNPLEDPPLEVAISGMKAIRNYFRQQEAAGKDRLYEAKLLIVGEGGSGKTTLAKKIKNPDYPVPTPEDSTKGIEVIQWSFPMENGRDFRVNIWDFGGQAIYHATHQFFLTKRSLYALVADTRKEDTDFYYWLNVVQLLSENSPLLIVKNEKQDRHRDINERQLRGMFENLKETLPTNLATNRGLPEILREIKHYISSLPHVGSVLPKTWIRVREALESDSRNYISLEEYLDICQKNGFTRRKDKLQLSGYLHDLGVILHFQDDPILNNTVILKPKWGTDAVYRVLDDSQVIRNLGRFTWNDLQNIWSEDEYANKQGELLQLMMKFELCYEIPNNFRTYIAPQLLTQNQPEYDWNEENNLILRYTYEFMPKGILTRFIVATNQYIDEKRYVWRSGVILSKDETKAEVIEYYGKREIKIRVAGKYKRDLLNIVTYELDKIHDSYKGRLKYQKLIPCNCSICKGSQNPHFYRFENLRKRIADRQTQVECDISYEKLDVLGLIDDVIGREKIQQQEQRKNEYGDIDIGTVGTLIIRQGNTIIEEPSKPQETSKPEVQVKLPWAYRNGMFYLLAFEIVFFSVAIFAGILPLYSLIVAVVATVFFLILIGVFQLRMDERLSEKSFVELVEIVVKQLPVLGSLLKSIQDLFQRR